MLMEKLLFITWSVSYGYGTEKSLADVLNRLDPAEYDLSVLPLFKNSNNIKPYGQVGNAKVQCLGQPVVRSGCENCPGTVDGVCQFTISQKLKVQVPVFFGARAEAGKAIVDCGCGQWEDCCSEIREDAVE